MTAAASASVPHDGRRARLTARVGGESGVGYVAVIAVTFLWGLGPLFVRGIDASPLTIAAWRNWLAVPIMLVVAYLAKAPLAWRWMKAALAGGVAFTLAQTLGFASFQETSLANAVLIGAISPVMIAVIAVPMFGEHLTRAQVALMAVSMTAVAVFVLSAGSTSGASLKGDLLAVGSLLAQTVYLLSVKRARVEGVPAAAYIAGVFIIGGTLITPMAALWGTSFTSITGEEWGYLVALAVIVGCCGHGLMTWAQKHVNVGIASVIILGTTVVSAVGGWIFFQQALTGVQIVAGLVVLATIAGILAIQIRQQDDEIMLVDLAEPPFAD
ncbi:MAG TPA: DMT family transporter [Acidimicrobiia bacterium]|nr:DMT family transporter [Acidimicrobiia bacterium]